MCTRKPLRRTKEIVAKVRLPSRNDMNCVVFYIFRHDEKFLRHARYANVLTNGEIPESRVLSNSFPCKFVDNCPRFGLNVRCWKESSESKPPFKKRTKKHHLHKNLLNLAFSPTKQIPTLSGRSAVVKPCCLAKPRTSDFLR